MSAYRVPLKTRFGNAKNVISKTYCICTEFISKTRFAIFNKVSIAVSSNLVCIVILFKIVTLIFPHRLRVCNAIHVEYRVVYRVVVSYILRVL